MYAICSLSVVPVRKEYSDRSEQLSQLLFGEIAEVVDKHENWRKIRIDWDDFYGWVDKKQLLALADEEFTRIKSLPATESLDIVQLVIWNQHNIIPVVIGSSLPGYHDGKFSINKTEFRYEGNVIIHDKPETEPLIEHAYMYLNAPYQWGGRSPFGIDCSGFTQMIYKMSGIKIRRDAWQQAEQGTPVHLLEESKPGDLAFFDNEEGKITHTGIILPGNKIIHASGRVRIDLIDHQGIFNEESGKYSHNLRLLKRHF